MENNTQIQLEGFGKLTIKEGSSFPLNFNIQNLKEPDSTPSSYSKDIIIIGDNDTNILLGQAFDVNISNSSFDINKKVSCNIIQNGSNVFKNGFFQLINVEKTGSELPNGESEIKYTGRVKSDLMNFFTTIKNKDLTDLNIYDPSTYTLLYRNNIISTFNNDVSDKYKFIPYYNGGSTIYPVKYFKPATYLQTYWDAIHKESGFEYQFDELEDLHFDKLLIPYTGGFEVSQETKDNYEVIVEDSTFHQNNYGCKTGYIPYNLSNTIFGAEEDFTVETKDNFNQFTLFNDTFTAAANSEYTFNFQMDFDHVMTNPAPGEGYVQGQVNTIGDNLTIQYELRYTVVSTNGNVTQHVEVINGASKVFLDRNDPNFDWSTDVLSPGSQTVNSGIANCSFTLPLIAGDMVFDYSISETYLNRNDDGTAVLWKYRDPISGTQEDNTACSVLNINSIYMNVTADLQYDLGTPVLLNKFIPKGVKQRDIVKSVIDMYKLIIEIDPTQPNKLIYTTRDKYYDDGDEKNWTKKLAKNKKINQQWLVASQGKTKKFTYKKDKDYYNTQYSDAIGDVYGEYDFDYLNDFNVGEDKVELTFSPTPTLHGEYNGMYTPALLPDEEYNIRLLYDGGTKDGYYFIQQNDGSYSTVEEGVYPLITHQDNPVNPGFDLNFGNCEFYFHNEYENRTQNNLWTLYHRRSLSQLYKGKLVTVFFQLDSTDILNFKYNDRIFINDSWYNVNKIVDYDANSNSLTKVELVTVDDGLSIDINRIVYPPIKPNPSNPWVAYPWVKSKEKRMITNNTVVVGSDVDIKGKGNVVQSNSKGNIIGDNNTINGSSMIIGDNSTDGGLNNKLVVGTNKIASEEYNALIGDVNIGEKVNIGEVDFTKVGMTYESEYVADNYVADGYAESFDAGITFDTSNDGTVNIQANELDLSGITNIIGSNTIEDITYSDLLTLRNDGDLDLGSTYHITDRDIWIRALDTDNLSTGGVRMMRCPLTTYYTPQTGGTDEYVGIYGETYGQGSVPASGGTTYYAIWGGKLWERNTSSDGGTTVNDIIDGGGWTLVTNTDVRYEDKYFSIEYDFDNDFISNQRDWKGNDLIGIVTSNGMSVSLNVLDITDWNDDKIYRNKCYGIYNNYGGIIFSNSNLGHIYNNYGVNIFNNSNLGPIYDNSNSGNISRNSNLGSIYDNSNSGSIFTNSNRGNIEDNSNNGNILRNSNNGDIFSNSNNGDIFSNSNTGSISSNSNLDINYNNNTGDILNNSITGIINENNNNGVIEGNLGNVGRINNNSNIGDIKDNNNDGNILKNSNAGYINNCSASVTSVTNNNNNGLINGTSLSGTISDTVVNKT